MLEQFKTKHSLKTGSIYSPRMSLHATNYWKNLKDVLQTPEYMCPKNMVSKSEAHSHNIYSGIELRKGNHRIYLVTKLIYGVQTEYVQLLFPEFRK